LKQAAINQSEYNNVASQLSQAALAKDMFENQLKGITLFFSTPFYTFTVTLARLLYIFLSCF